MTEPVVIFVKGGSVLSVYGAEDYVVIDWDVLEIGRCPLCNEEMDGTRDYYCSVCDLDWYMAKEEDFIEQLNWDENYKEA